MPHRELRKRYKGLSFDLNSLEVRVASHPIELTLTELKIVYFLLYADKRSLSKDELILRIWGDAAISPKTLVSHCHNLRTKIAEAKVSIEIDSEGLVKLASL